MAIPFPGTFSIVRQIAGWNQTAANLFKIIACLQRHEGVRLQVVA
jgi:hypothetical protein